MKKYISYLYTLALSQTARSTYLTTFGAGLNAFLGFVFTIVVARSITPADFGYFSVVLNFVMILFVICDVGLSSSVLKFLPQAIREGRKKKAQKIIKLSFLATLLISGVLTAFLFFLSSPLSSLIFAKSQLALPLMIVSFSLLGLTMSFLFASILQGQQRFLFGVITESSVMATKVLVTLALLFLGKLNLISVLVVYTTTSFVGFLIGFFLVGPSFLGAPTDFSLARNLIKFGAWVALARIANSISSKIDTIMLARFVEAAEVGFYAAAQKMTFIFPVLVNGVMVVLSPKFAALKTVEEVKPFAKKSTLLISVLFIPIVVLFILAPWVTVWIFGKVYQPSIYIFRWLLVSSTFFVATTVPMVAILYWFGASRFFAVISFVQLTLIIIGNLVLIPKLGVIGPAISLAFSYAVIFLLSSFFVVRHLKEK